MADIVFNIAKGRAARYADLPATNDALVLVLLKASGLEADSVLRTHATLAAILGAANDEADFTGYTRRTLAGVTVTPVAGNNDADATDPASYTNSGGASQSVGKAIICYDPDTTGGTDADLVPLVALDCVVTFDVGVPVTLSFAAAGFFRAS